MGKWQNHKKTSHTREIEVSPFTAGDNKAEANRLESMENTKHNKKKKHRFEN